MAHSTSHIETGGASLAGRAAGAGIVAGLLFGIMIQFGLHRMTAIGAMYTLGQPSLSIGWIAHIGHSALFGALFGLAVERGPLARYAKLPHSIGLGLGFAVILWMINIVFLWPLWLNAVGVPGAPSMPFVTSVMPLVGHLVYGAILGGLFPLVVD